MPPLANPTLWRTHPHTQEFYLYVHKPEVIFSCSVNQTIFTYPIAVITYDTVTVGAYTDIELNQLVRVKDSGGTFKGWGRVRLDPTSSELYIGHVSPGEIDFADNDIVEVLDDYRPQIKVPRELKDGTMYKDYDLEYTDQGDEMGPKCNSGGPVAAFIGGDDLIHVDFDLTDKSFPVAAGATLSSYGGSIGDGSVESGTIASGVFTAGFPAGFRWCNLTTTDSNGKVGLIHTPVLATDGSDLLPCQISNHRVDAQSGATLEFVVNKADLSKTEIVPGSLVILFAKEVYGTTEGSLQGPVGRHNICFVGWLKEARIQANPNTDDVSFVASDIINKLATIEAFPSSLFNATNPSKWNQIKSLSLMRYMIHLLHWHSTVFELCDLIEPDWTSTYLETPKRLDADAGLLLQQMQTAAGYVDALFLADKNGRLMCHRNPQFMTDSDRENLVTTVTLQSSDYTTVEWTERQELFVYWLRGSGVIADNSAVTAKLSIAPGSSPSQGPSEDSLERQLILDQNDLNVRTGRKYTLVNHEIPDLRIELPNGGRVIDVAYAELIKFNLPVTTNRRRTVFSDTYFIAKEVDIRYDINGTTVESIVLEPLVYGVAGETLAVPKNKLSDISFVGLYDFVPPEIASPIEPIVPVAFASSPHAFSWGDTKIGRLRRGAGSWESLIDVTQLPMGTLTTTVTGFWLDPWNPKTKGYVRVNRGFLTDSVIYEVNNLDAEVGQQTATVILSVGTDGFLEGQSAPYAELASINADGFLACGYYSYVSNGGNNIYRRQVRGAKFTRHQVKLAHTTNGKVNIALGHHAASYSSGKIYARIKGDSGQGQIYKSTNMGLTWTLDYTFPGGTYNGSSPALIHVPYHNNQNDNILYSSSYFNDAAAIVRRNEDGSYDEIGIPAGGGVYYGAASLYSCTKNRLKIALSTGTGGGLYRTLDGGDTYEEVTPASGNPTFPGLWGYPADEDMLFIQNANGLFYSTNFFSAVDGPSINWEDITYDFEDKVHALNLVQGLVASWTN